MKDVPEDRVTISIAGLRDVAETRGGGEVEDVTEVRVGLSSLPASLGMSPVLPPDLHLLPAEVGGAPHHLHLLHGEEGEVVEPPGEDGHCLTAVGSPGLLTVSLALCPGGE